MHFNDLANSKDITTNGSYLFEVVFRVSPTLLHGETMSFEFRLRFSLVSGAGFRAQVGTASLECPALFYGRFCVQGSVGVYEFFSSAVFSRSAYAGLLNP